MSVFILQIVLVVLSMSDSFSMQALVLSLVQTLYSTRLKGVRLQSRGPPGASSACAA